MNGRKVARNMKKTKDKKARRKGNMFSWNDIDDLYNSCLSTIANNLSLMRKVTELNEEEVDYNKINETLLLAGTVSKELYSEVKSVHATHSQHSGRIAGMEQNDLALIVLDRYQNLTSSITEQYSMLLDALYLASKEEKIRKLANVGHLEGEVFETIKEGKA